MSIVDAHPETWTTYPNNLDIQHPRLRPLNNTEAGASWTASLSLLFHAEPQPLELLLLRHINPLFGRLRLPHNRYSSIHERRVGTRMLSCTGGSGCRSYRVVASVAGTRGPQHRWDEVRKRLKRQPCRERGGHERRQRRGIRGGSGRRGRG